MAFKSHFRNLSIAAPFSLTITLSITLSITLLITLGGCAGEKAIVDTKGVSPSQYEQDVSECTEYADEVELAGKTAAGAVTGAVVGAALGGIWDGYRGASVERGAASGAVLGGAGGATSGASERKRVIRNCLQGRGYRVLN